MTFDPLADIIDLRDVMHDVEFAGNEPWSPAAHFLLAMVRDLGYDPAFAENLMDKVREIADNEPTVIARRYFVEYAQELAEDIGSVPTRETNRGAVVNWPLYCIDWEYAAKELEQDYSSFTYDGREYLIRSV